VIINLAKPQTEDTTNIGGTPTTMQRGMENVSRPITSEVQTEPKPDPNPSAVVPELASETYSVPSDADAGKPGPTPDGDTTGQEGTEPALREQPEASGEGVPAVPVEAKREDGEVEGEACNTVSTSEVPAGFGTELFAEYPVPARTPPESHIRRESATASSIPAGIVISGFAGIGKTHLFSNTQLNIRDSDSSNFSKDETFPANYIAHILEARKKYDVVLVSCHAPVREAMRNAGIDYTLVYPSAAQKDLYIGPRNGHKPFVDILAKNWYDWIASCRNDPIESHIILNQDQYLSDVIEQII
jgi:hypothetical protein